jgi:hypothetical protein
VSTLILDGSDCHWAEFGFTATQNSPSQRTRAAAWHVLFTSSAKRTDLVAVGVDEPCAMHHPLDVGVHRLHRRNKRRSKQRTP